MNFFHMSWVVKFVYFAGVHVPHMHYVVDTYVQGQIQGGGGQDPPPFCRPNTSVDR